MKNDEQETKQQWKMMNKGKKGNMMKKREQTMKHDEKEWKKTTKNDEKERTNNETWRKREKKDNEKWWKREKKTMKTDEK